VSYYLPKHFAVVELVPPDIYQVMGEGAIILMDDRILRIADAVRDHFDVPVTINNWKVGGQFSQRGFRTVQQAGGAGHSAHFYGRAIDFDVQGLTADEVRKEILSNSSAGDFPLISGMEMGIPWVHLDCANRYSTNGIVQFSAPGAQ
jgi:Peptidase M15